MDAVRPDATPARAAAPSAPPESTVLLDALTGAFPVVVFELDPDGVYLAESGAGRARVLERYPGHSPVGRSAFDLYADAPEVLANLRRALAGEAFVARVEVPRSDGTFARFEVVYTPVFHPDGRLDRLLGVALDVTDREAAARQTVRDAERLRRLSARLQTEREAERTRIARTVHDAVGSALTAIRFDARWLARQLAAERPVDREAVLARLCDVDAMLDQAVGVVRDLATELRPPVLDELGLSAALASYAVRFTQRTGIAATLDAPLSDADEAAVGGARATTAFRIMQEALTNVARHAGAGHVTLRLSVVHPTADVLGELPRGWDAPDSEHVPSAPGRALVVEIEDDGCGISPEAVCAGTPGLTGMAERAAGWGGTLYVGQAGGTVVRAVVPLGGAG